MITLRPLRQDEFAGYLDYFLPDYAEEIADNYDLSKEEARARAENEIAHDLPEGPQTKGETMLCIERTEGPAELVGYLWVTEDKGSASLFIKDFHILPEHQRQGLGKAALEKLGEHAAAEGLGEIRLRVAGNNTGARKLYETSGFHVTGVNMSKKV